MNARHSRSSSKPKRPAARPPAPVDHTKQQNEKGDDAGKRRPIDFPSEMLACAIKAEAQVTLKGIEVDGSVVFSVPLRDLGLTSAAILRTLACRRTFFANVLGEVLVRQNLSSFSDELEQMDSDIYDALVNTSRHVHFGMGIDSGELLVFDFHISLVQSILCENTTEIFRKASEAND